MSTAHEVKVKQKQTLPSKKPSDSRIAIVTFFVVIPAIILAGFGYVTLVQSSWTGTGKVVEQGQLPSSDGSFLNCGLLGVGGPCFFQDSSHPEQWYLKVRERNGSDHTFHVTREQFENAKVGKQFTKQ